jgi:hypothetical protein
VSAWDDFIPFVLPYAPGCPDPTLEHHIRLAAIEFCRKTNVWQADLAPLVGDGVLRLFTMVPPTEAQVAKLLGVAISDTYSNVVDAGIKQPLIGAQLVRDQTSETIAFTDDLATLTVWPVQAVDASIVAKVALKPTMAATTLPSVLFGNYAQDIATGALSTILSMPKKDWTDMPAAGIAATTFRARMSVVARAVERGFAKSCRRSSTRWF